MISVNLILDCILASRHVRLNLIERERSHLVFPSHLGRINPNIDDLACVWIRIQSMRVTVNHPASMLFSIPDCHWEVRQDAQLLPDLQLVVIFHPFELPCKHFMAATNGAVVITEHEELLPIEPL